MSTLKVTNIQDTAGVQQYLCKAWVNFNGTGTVAIRAAGNVSSITDNGVGDYTVNFTNAMVDANYGFTVGGSSPAVTNLLTISPMGVAPSVSAFRFGTVTAGGILTDASQVAASFFR